MAEDWLADVRKYAADADETVVAAIVKYCGIALQSRDSSLVAMSDKKERELVRENYLKKKLGLSHPDADLDAAVVAVGQTMKADRTKNRVTVYYLLAEHFGSLGIFGGAAGGSAASAAMAGGAVGLAAMAPAAAAAASKGGGATAPKPHGGKGKSRDDFDMFGWGCGIAALVIGAIILAALLAWWASRPAAAPAPAPAAVVAAPEPAAPAPAAVAEPIPVGAGVTTGERNGKPMLTVYFDTAKSDVTKDLAAAAANVKDYIAKNPTAKLAVSGFNDPTGNAAANAELSKKRAQAVGKALEDVGIPAAAIELVKPAETTDTSGDNTNARRVEVVVQ